jgi:hypothetical protein
MTFEKAAADTFLTADNPTAISRASKVIARRGRSSGFVMDS